MTLDVRTHGLSSINVDPGVTSRRKSYLLESCVTQFFPLPPEARCCVYPGVWGTRQLPPVLWEISSGSWADICHCIYKGAVV